MRKSSIAIILARHLGMTASRVNNLAARLADVGLVSKAEGSRRYPPDLPEPEVVRLVIAALTDTGLGDVVRNVEFFATLRGPAGRFDAVLHDMIFGPPRQVAHHVIRHAPAGASMVVDGQHMLFGAEAPEGAAINARIVPGGAFMALAADLQRLKFGVSP